MKTLLPFAAMVGAILAGVAISTAGVWSVQTQDVTVDITITALVDGKPLAASGVQKVELRRVSGGLFSNVNGTNARAWGQAPVISIDGNTAVVALMAYKNSSDNYPQNLLKGCGILGPGTNADRSMSLMSAFPDNCTLPTVDYPTIITIVEKLNPNTIEALPPGTLIHIGNHSIQIDDVTLRRTNSPLVYTLADYFPWVISHHNGNIYDLPHPNDTPNGLNLDVSAFLQRER